MVKAAKMAGFEIIGGASAVEDTFRERFATRRLLRMQGGFAELAAPVIQSSIAQLAIKTFGIHDAYSIGVGDENNMFGAVHILTRTADACLPATVIESFVYQCFLALRNLRAQRELIESREQFRRLTESIKDVVWTLDPETLRFLYVSPSVEGLRGYTPEEVMAQPMDAALTPEGSVRVREILAQRTQAIRDGQTEDVFHVEELEQPCKDGSRVWTEVVTSHYFNELTGRYEVRGVSRDITERRRSEESIRVYAQLLEASPASINVVSDEGEFLYANEFTFDMHGYTREEFMALNLGDVDVADESDPYVSESWASRAEQRGDHVFEVLHRRKDGSTFPMTIHARTGTWEGRPVILTVGTDITDSKRAEQEILDSNERLAQMVRDVAEAMGRIVEVRDPYTQGHEERVAKLAVLIGEDMGLSADEIAGLEMAAVVHDIGKLCVPAEILNKAGKLLDIEFELIKQHPLAGFEILKDIAFPWDVAAAVLQHHERIDGSGYPYGLIGDQICQTARILAVADVIEAMASHRPYRPALSVDAGMAEVMSHPEQYDSEVVASCVRLHEAGRIVW